MKTEIIRYNGKDSLKRAADIIRHGGTVVFPTETVYGLGANALDGSAAKKIYEAKGRPSDNPLIVHLSTYENAGIYCHTDKKFFDIAKAFMPGPLTVIMKKREFIPDSVTGGLDTVGIRVPENQIARELIELSGLPIAAPSANISGKPSPTRFEHAYNDLNGRVNAIIDGGECTYGVESTIIKMDKGNIKLLRPGAVTPEMLSLFSDSIEIDPAVLKKFDGVPLAPGMKYRHYAPNVPLHVVESTDEEFYHFVSDKINAGIICFDEDKKFINNSVVLSCGPSNDSLTQARKIFDCLRESDKAENIDVVYARMPSKIGIGLAVFNRLIKAAGYSIIKLS